jgi:hypothetical protein
MYIEAYEMLQIGDVGDAALVRGDGRPLVL